MAYPSRNKRKTKKESYKKKNISKKKPLDLPKSGKKSSSSKSRTKKSALDIPKLPSKGGASKKSALDIPKLPSTTAKKKKRISSDALDSKQASQSSKSFFVKEEENTVNDRINLFVRFFLIGFGSLYCIGLGFFFSANRRIPFTPSDLIAVVTNLSRVFPSTSTSSPTSNTDHLIDIEEDGGADKKEEFAIATDTLTEGKALFRQGKHEYSQGKILRGKKKLEKALKSFEELKEFERDPEQLKLLEEKIIETQRFILDAGKSLHFGK